MRLSRRAVTGGLVAALGVGSPTVLFADIARRRIGPETDAIATAGHGAHGLGAALYRRVAGAEETPFSTRSADGGWWLIANDEVTPEMLGAAADSSNDDDAFLAAARLARPMRLGAARPYRLGRSARITAPLAGPGVIAAAPGFGGDVLLRGEAGASLRGVTLDAGSLPAPTGPWLGVGAPRGCAVAFEGRPDAPLTGVTLQGLVVRNSPSGAVFMRNVRGFEVGELSAQRVQTHTVAITSAVVEVYGCEDGALRDCEIRDYAWKGYAIDAGRRIVATACVAHGGAPGHAAHYMDGSQDCGFVGCRHDGPGYGAKATASTRPYFKGYVAEGSAGGVEFQSCRDFLAEDVTVRDPATAALVVASGPGGPSTGGEIRRAKVAWSDAGRAAALQRVGLSLASNGAPAAQILGLKVSGLAIDAPFHGVRGLSQPGAVVDVDIEDLTITAPQQYAMIVFVRSMRLAGLTVRAGQTWRPAVAIYTAPGVAGGDLTLSKLDLTGGKGGGAMVEIGVEAGRSAAFQSIAVTDCTSSGPGGLVAARLPISVTQLTFTGNTARGVVSGPAADLRLAPDSRAAVAVSANTATDASGRAAEIRITPPAALAAARRGANRARLTPA